MSIKRLTFNESWYRVEDLRPQLRPTVQISRQSSRGNIWYVLRNGGNNEYLRLREEAYSFVALLNGKRTVAEVWWSTIERKGDQALTQGEIIQLLSQLYTSGFLKAEVTPDSATIFQRFNAKKSKKIAGNLWSILFLRIPLFDPDNIFDRISRLSGWLFSLKGFIVWAALIITGSMAVIGRWQELSDEFNGIIEPSNIFSLYLVYFFIKLVHESGHGVACKWIGRHEKSNEVRSLGVMLLLFMPMPYVDVSSCWMFKSKWKRFVVSCGGVYFELMIAAVAAFIWSKTGAGSIWHTLSYNAMVTASIGSILFNANPLMKFDGYYALSDWLEIPNLSGSSRKYLTFLIKRLVWGIKRIQSPAQNLNEALIFSVYGLLSLFWQAYVSFKIMVFVMDKYLFIGTMLALLSILMWSIIPASKLFSYLSGSPDLEHQRFRAVLTTIGFLGAFFFFTGVLRVGDNWRADGVVEPVRKISVYSSADGSLVESRQSDMTVEMRKTKVVNQKNIDIDTEIRVVSDELSTLVTQERMARNEEKISESAVLNEKIKSARKKLEKALSEKKGLDVYAPESGVLIAPRINERQGSWVRKGEYLGSVVSQDAVRLRVVIEQMEAARLFATKDYSASFMIEGRPDIGNKPMEAKLERIVPVGSTWIPNAALGFSGGGSLPVKNEKEGRQQGIFNTFEVWLEPMEINNIQLFPGQRVIVRFEFPAKPLLFQWYRKIRQILNPHFQG